MDPTMEIMLAIGQALTPPGGNIVLPPSMEQPAARAALMQAIDGPTVLDFTSPITVGATIGTRLAEIVSASGPLMLDVPDAMLRLTIALRFWAGCMEAAKLLRDVDGAGAPVTPAMRTEGFADHVDMRAAQDPIYRAGVEAAPMWRRHHRQQTNFDAGVPATSHVRTHWVA